MRIELHGTLVVSNDLSSAPIDLVFQSGPKSLIDTTSYPLGDGKVVNLPPSTTNQLLALDGVTSVAVAHILTQNNNVSVTLVPTGQIVADCKALKLIPGCPLVIGSDLAGIYFSNSDTNNSAQVHVGYAGT